MVRLSREAREQHMVECAVRFFSERGFSGQTRELARELGVTQPLLYRYFPSKQHLVDRVYQELFEARWKGSWEVLVTDRRRPLRERLLEFWTEYAGSIFSRAWVRLFVYSGLNGGDYNRRALEELRKKIFRRIAIELRHEFGYPATKIDLVTQRETEFIWEVHGMLFYYYLRQYVYEIEPTQTSDEMVEMMVDVVFATAPIVLRRATGRDQAGGIAAA